MVQHDIKKYKQMSNQKHFKSNEASQSALAEQFEAQFDKAFTDQLKSGLRLYLIDLLEDTYLLDKA